MNFKWIKIEGWTPPGKVLCTNGVDSLYGYYDSIRNRCEFNECILHNITHFMFITLPN